MKASGRYAHLFSASRTTKNSERQGPECCHQLEGSLVRRETQLKGLAVVLDAGTFGETLQSVVPSSHVTDPQITYVRYKPGRRCVVSYRAVVNGTPMHLYAKALSEKSWSKHRRFVEGIKHTRLDRPVANDAIQVVLYPFPYDRRLPVLLRVARAAPRRCFLQRILPSREQTWTGSVETLQYKPERRYVASVRVDGSPVAVLKLYDKLRFPRAFANSARFKAATNVAVVSRIGRSRRHRALVFPWLHGKQLEDEIHGGLVENDDLWEVGAALAALHASASRTFQRVGAERASAPRASDWFGPDTLAASAGSSYATVGP